MNENEKTVYARLTYIGVKNEEISIKSGYVYYRNYMLNPVHTVIQCSMLELANDLDRLRQLMEEDKENEEPHEYRANCQCADCQERRLGVVEQECEYDILTSREPHNRRR